MTNLAENAQPTHAEGAQPSLFLVPDLATIPQIPAPAATEEDSIQAKFAAFHHDNPWVYSKLRKLALDEVRAGRNKTSIKMLWEVLRWETGRATIDHTTVFRLNNVYTAHYARMLAANEPELADVFETRRLRAA